MEGTIERMNRLAEACSCGSHNRIALDEVRLARGALSHMAAYLGDRGCRRPVMVADIHTYRAAGAQALQLLAEAGISCKLLIVRPNGVGDVVADEASIVAVMTDVAPETDMLIAVGSGTLHDIVRFTAFKMGKPFISVPTAPSVDGFTSKGAPILMRGEKITVPACSPDAIFADLDVLAEAPANLVAAGFGDMLGKYTSLFDWSFGRLTADEPYCEAAAELTRAALESCVEHVGDIAELNEEGIRILMGALIESGFAMLIFGQSHPASGAEHHLSHHWEMDYLRLGRKQALHGAKVGAACGIVAGLYARIAAEEPFAAALAEAEAKPTVVASGDGEADAGESKRTERLRRIVDAWPEIRAAIACLPSREQLRAWLTAAGGPARPEELGVSDELLRRSLAEAHGIRPNRHTLLKAYNELLSNK